MAVLLALVTNDYYTIIMLMMIVIQVWQYYLLPDEEQRMPGRKNPMCNTFPRIGDLGDNYENCDDFSKDW